MLTRDGECGMLAGDVAGVAVGDAGPSGFIAGDAGPEMVADGELDEHGPCIEAARMGELGEGAHVEEACGLGVDDAGPGEAGTSARCA